MFEQIASIQDVFIHLFGNAGRGIDSGRDKKVVFVVQTVVSRALAKGFLSGAFYSAVEQAVHKCVPNHTSTDAAVAKLAGNPHLQYPWSNVFQAVFREDLRP